MAQLLSFISSSGEGWGGGFLPFLVPDGLAAGVPSATGFFLDKVRSVAGSFVGTISATDDK